LTTNLLARIEVTGGTHAIDETLEKSRLLKRIQVGDRVAGSSRHHLTASGERTIGISMKSAIEAAPFDVTKTFTKRVLKIQQFGWCARFHMRGRALGVKLMKIALLDRCQS
jgi:hypothetical protein